jgi:predicted Mrr-cat superfamily restriction endonuclease
MQLTKQNNEFTLKLNKEEAESLNRIMAWANPRKPDKDFAEELARELVSCTGIDPVANKIAQQDQKKLLVQQVKEQKALLAEKEKELRQLKQGKK